MEGKKYYYNFTIERYITLKEYNKLAKQASRQNIPVQQYLEQKGWTKVWGNGQLKMLREVI